MMERIFIAEQRDRSRVEEALDAVFIEYDWDGGDRLMVSSEDIEYVARILDQLGVEWEII